LNSLAVIAGPDVSICSGSSTQLTASGATGYNWSPSTGLNDPNIQNPTATPAQTTTYVVTGTDGVCFATDTILYIGEERNNKDEGILYSMELK
jgi:hypothetical protein